MAGLRQVPVQLTSRLLSPADVRRRASELNVRPSKQRGQNFVIDANTIRRLVRLSAVSSDDVVVEIGPGLGSLTLGLLDAARAVVAVEIDAALAEALPATCADQGADTSRLHVVTADAMHVTSLPVGPTVLVANLPYNVAVPVLLHVLATFPSVQHGLVMVQREVADRLTAGPGSRTYGVPSVKLAWYAAVRAAGSVPQAVFWPVPNVESGLVAFTRRDPPATSVSREGVFRVIDAAFAQRRKTLRNALAAVFGDARSAESALRAVGVDPALRGEALSVADFARIAGVAAT